MRRRELAMILLRAGWILGLIALLIVLTAPFDDDDGRGPDPEPQIIPPDPSVRVRPRFEPEIARVMTEQAE